MVDEEREPDEPLEPDRPEPDEPAADEPAADEPKPGAGEAAEAPRPEETVPTAVLPREVPPPEAEARPSLEGTVLSGRYRLLEQLGEGGMGVVYRAEHTLMRKTVAVKLLHPELTTVDDIVRRFEREAQAAANIDHPNVCAATDFGRAEDGSFFLVMEYLEGRTLDDLLAELGSLPVRRAVGIARQVCAALDRAHSMGIVHRDLKPENVLLVERDGEPDFVKVLDFGIARVPVEDAAVKTLTRAGMVMGTPSYLSPEQATGRPTDLSTDIYSLGVTLFEMVAGRRPFESPSAVELLGMHATRPPPRLSKLAAAARVTPRLERLVGSMLAKEPHLRPAGARQVRDELDAVLAELDGPRGRVTSTLGPALEAARRRLGSARATLAPLPRWVWLALPLVLLPPLALVLVAASFRGSEAAPSSRAVVRHEPGVSTGGAGAGGPAALAPAPPRPPSRLELARRRPDVQRALAARATGGNDAVLAELRRLHREERSPELAFLLAEAESMAGTPGRALELAETALEAAPELAAEPGFRAFVMGQLESRQHGWRAGKILGSHYMPGATRELAAVACAPELRSGRRRAIKILREAEALELLEPWCRLTIELDLASSCEGRRAVVRSIEALGDPRAAPALERVRTGTTGRLFAKRRENTCLLEDLRRARRRLAPPGTTDESGD